MATREEEIWKRVSENFVEQKLKDPKYKGEPITEAMREYAREMSIGFDFWKNSNYEPVEEGNYQGLFISKFFDGSHGKSHITPKLHTREELYNLYLTSINKQ